MREPFGINSSVLGVCCALAAFASGIDVDDAQARTETVIYSFQNNGADGSGPVGTLFNGHGVLYGATVVGGSGNCRNGQGCGTIFSLDPATGAEAVLYSFQNNDADGNYPQAGVIELKGILYGTTLGGGAYNDAGTVYSVNPSTGAEAVLHSFDQNGKDGVGPEAGLIAFHGSLYGTTSSGGAYGGGTVYSVNPSTGAETVLHSFGNENGNDGLGPLGGLINVHGALYGTTAGGGDRELGAVFSIDPTTGAEKVVYSFCSQTHCADGEGPAANLIDASGILYGTTFAGGSAGGCGGSSMGCGVVFSFDPNTGAEATLYKFQNNGADGITPSTGLTNLLATLYGATTFGGAYGFGTVYSINPGTGAESVLHAFGDNGMDAENPSGALLHRGGKLYGNALGGGAQSWGAVFKINPGRQPAP